MPHKTSRFEFEWWIIQKRMIYLLVSNLIMCGLAAGGALYVWKYGNPLKDIGTNLKASSGARFISFEGDVRIIRAATRETIRAGSNTELYPGDTVQTGASGRARLGMADGSVLVVRPDSTIIVRDNASTDDGKRTNVHVVVDSGQMSVRTEQQPAGTNNVVETPNTKNKVSGQTAASFGVGPEGTEIRVNSGGIQTTDSTGQQTALGAGQYAKANPSGTLGRPQKLLDVPNPAEPHDLQKVLVGNNGSANVSLKWQRPQSGSPAYYRVEVATSPFFVANGKVVERDQLVANEFSASDLRPGVYFWRVRATDQTGQNSDWCEAQKFVVAPKGTGSVAVTSLSAELLGGNIYLVRGKAEPGTVVRINGRETSVPTDKSFQLQITVTGETREVVLEADDLQGNNSQYKVALRGRSKGG
jgi:hypothetical protein